MIAGASLDLLVFFLLFIGSLVVGLSRELLDSCHIILSTNGANESKNLIATKEAVRRYISIDESIRLFHNTIIFDARASSAYSKGRLPGAVSIPKDQFEKIYASIRNELEENQSQRIIIYCASDKCSDADDVYANLDFYGFTDMYILRGGWHAWREAGFPVEK